MREGVGAMSDYTPTTAEIRRRATEPRYEKYDRRKALVRLLEGEFDRWLSELIRKEREEAWDEGYDQCWVYHTSEGMQGTQQNPHRREQP